MMDEYHGIVTVLQAFRLEFRQFAVLLRFSMREADIADTRDLPFTEQGKEI